MPSKRRARRGHRDSGAVAVETSVVSMLLVLLLFGIVETSFLLKDWMTVSSAARAGARMGASQPRSATFAQDTANQVTNAITGLDPTKIQAVWVYKATSTTGFPDSGSFASCSACVKFVWTPGSPGSLTPSSSNWPGTSQNACQGDPARESLGVYVNYKHSSPLGFFFKDMTVAESTVMWLEPYTATPTCKP
jgi:Flp pilus assembly protein TadG